VSVIPTRGRLKIFHKVSCGLFQDGSTLSVCLVDSAFSLISSQYDFQTLNFQHDVLFNFSLEVNGAEALQASSGSMGKKSELISPFRFVARGDYGPSPDIAKI
jgi:hypothetical protein